MAVTAELLIPVASREDADAFDASIEAAMMQRGGPPAGLMLHLMRPADDGFLLMNVWRTEAESDAFYTEVIEPTLAAHHLAHESRSVDPVWTMARP